MTREERRQDAEKLCNDFKQMSRNGKIFMTIVMLILLAIAIYCIVIMAQCSADVANDIEDAAEKIKKLEEISKI